MNETSLDPAMAESSQKNPPSSFSFQIHPASSLIQAIEPLIDAEFNEGGMGMIELGRKEFEITVRNSTTRVVGYLCLRAFDLINFDFHKSMDKKLINLTQIFCFLSDADADDEIVFHHVHGSNELCFTFGSSSNMYRVDLLEVDEQFKMVQDISSYEYECEAVLHPVNLRDLLQLVEELAPMSNLATCDVTDWSVSFTVLRKTIILKSEIKGMNPDGRIAALFKCHHGESLNKALPLSDRVVVCLTSDQERIMWKFELQGHGEVVYVMEARSVIPSIASIYGMDETLLPR